MIIISTLIAMLILSLRAHVALAVPHADLHVAHASRWGAPGGRSPRKTQKTMADITAITEETLSVSGILLSKAFGRQDHEIGRFREENERLAGFRSGRR